MNIEVLPVVGLDAKTFRKYMAVVWRLKDGSLEPVHTLTSHVEEAVEYDNTLYIKAADLSEEDRMRFSGNLKYISINPVIASVSGEEFSQDEKLLPSNIDGGRDIISNYPNSLYRYQDGKLTPVLSISGDISIILGSSGKKSTFFVLSRLPENVAQTLERTYVNDVLTLNDIPKYLGEEDFNHVPNAL
jgi:hypothetical protein